MLQNVRARIRIPLEGRAVSWVKFRAFVPFTSSFPPHFLPPEPVSVTLWRDVQRVWVNLRCVLIPSERSSLRDWDLWGPFFFIITLALLLSSSATHNKVSIMDADQGMSLCISLHPSWTPASCLFICVTSLSCTPLPHTTGRAHHILPEPLPARLLPLTHIRPFAPHCTPHVALRIFLSLSPAPLSPSPQGGRIIFFQSLSLLGYCLVPLDLAALLCLLTTAKLARMALVLVTFAWSSSAAYPFVAKAVPETRRVLAVYPVFLLYTAIGFLVLAND
ncbi:unnamed protein product [Closterium sp. NIES-65]|nr:unnamed protein product [Closterium sp. NIES-65]CAI6009110.1 unnamed protein product [Closterium sp. NIES-65]